jgi:hypothetical protein
MGWRLIDGGRDCVPTTASVAPPVRPVPKFPPSAFWVNSRIVGATSKGRLVDAAIVLAFVAMLIGMWMMTMR